MAMMALAGDNRSSTTARLRDCGERLAGFPAPETATCPARTGGGSGGGPCFRLTARERQIAETDSRAPRETSPFAPDALAIPRRKYAARIIAAIIAARIFNVARSSA